MGSGRLACVVFCFCSILTAAELPQPAQFQGSPIVQIQFQPPAQPLDAQQINRVLGLPERARLEPTEVRAAIKRLYATGRYDNIEVDAEPAPGGVRLIFRTQEQWFIGPVEVKGKLKLPPNRGQLVNAAALDLGQPFLGDSLQGAVDGIQGMLRKNGFYQAKVEPSVQRDAAHQQVLLTFQVEPGKRARLDHPEITGDTRIPAEKLASAAKWKGWFRWKLDTQDNVQSGITRIQNRYTKDERLTASVDLKGMTYEPAQNRAKPVVEANGGPKVKITTSGAKVSRKTLKRYVPVFDEGTVNRDLLVDGARNLRDYFQSQGYFAVNVDFHSQDLGPDQRRITYVIAPGPRHKLVKVTVRGNHYFTSDIIQERMFLQPAGLIRLRHGRYSEGFVKSDEDALTALYHANGYRDVQVTTQTIDDYQGKTGNVAVTVSIVEGPQYSVSDFTLSGVNHFKPAEIMANLASAKGQPFSEVSVGMDRDYILGRYQAEGFPNASFDWRASPGPLPHEMKVEYFVTEGKEQYVRDVLVSGLHVTRERLVRPDILLKPGDPLSWSQMGEMQRRLYNLGVFNTVDMAMQNPDGATDRKYVLYHLVEGPRYTVAMGAGGEFARIAGSQTSLNSPAGQTGLAPRGSLEVSRLNLWGLGHTLSFKSAFSTLDRRGSLNYIAPNYRNVEGRDLSFTALYDDTRDVNTFTARRMEASAQWSEKLSKPSRIMFRYSFRDVRVDSGSLKIEPLLIPLLSQPVYISMLSTSFIQDRRDDPSDAHRGIYNTADFGIASNMIGSHTNFARFLGRNSWYHPLPNEMVFAMNTEFGWLGPFKLAPGINAADAIPLAERFFGGGSTSMRGFPDNQAGPRDLLTGFPLGGNALLFHSTELRFPLIGQNVQGVLFHDMGNIYSTPGKISFRYSQRDLTDFNYMVHAVGFGIRFRTPVGPLRLDLAYSLNPPNFMGLQGSYQDLLAGTAPRVRQSVSHFQFFFSIGQAF